MSLRFAFWDNTKMQQRYRKKESQHVLLTASIVLLLSKVLYFILLQLPNNKMSYLYPTSTTKYVAMHYRSLYISTPADMPLKYISCDNTCPSLWQQLSLSSSHTNTVTTNLLHFSSNVTLILYVFLIS